MSFVFGRSRPPSPRKTRGPHYAIACRTYLPEGRPDRFEILQGYDWYLKGDQFDPRRITAGWSEKLNDALALGYEGLRVSGNAFWFERNQWKEFSEYEHELDQSIADQKMIVMCTYSLRESCAVDILDVVRAHNFTLARRNGEWEFLESPELKQAKAEINKLQWSYWRAVACLHTALSC